MRVCIFMTSFLPLIGGAERSADLIARGLLARGHDVRILAQWTGCRPRDLPYPVSYYRRLPRQNLLPEALFWPLLRTWWSWRFDVVLAFDSYPAGYAATCIKGFLGTPVIISPRGGDLLSDNCSLQRARVSAAMIRGYQSADRIIAISQWLKTRLCEVAGEKLPPNEVIYNGIDLASHDELIEESRAHPPPMPLGPPFILHLSRVNPHKQQTTAIRAVHQLRGLFIKHNLKYAIVGEGRGMAEVEALVKELQLGEIVLLLGSRSGLERAWLYDKASLFVSASLGEGLGNVVIEAAASGLPILASDIPATREILADHPAALLFEPGNPQDLAAKLQTMIESPFPKPTQAAATIRERFSLPAMIDGYEKALLHCCNAGVPAAFARAPMAGASQLSTTK